jgi:CBS domain containing-hemolysin-like protein
MLLSSLILVVIFIVCLILSAVFSGSETAFFSLSKWQLSKMEEDKRKHVRTVEKLLEKGDDLLNGILLGNLLVSIAAASSATFLSHYLFTDKLLLSEGTIYIIDILLITVLILLFGEISPKVYAVDNPDSFSSRVAPFLNAWIILIKPFIMILSFMTGAAKKLVSPSGKTPRFTEEELLTTVSTTMDNGNVDKIMMQKIFTFGDTMVKEIMVPRTNMLCIEEDTPIEEVYKQVKEIEHSRIPLYKENLDSITGILYSKDLLGYAFGFRDIRGVDEIKKPAHFVPEFKKVNDLLREFQRMKVHIAIVVDEYGGTEGLVTLEDVIEEIVGEIQDEYDREEPDMIQIRDGVFLVDGLMNIDDFQETLGIKIEGEGFETLGGYIFSLMGKIPKQGDEISRDSLSFRIYRVIGKRVSKVIVKKLPEISTSGDEEQGKGDVNS